jgi:uncharacterized protein involved in oxidation of intracellular sulfur
VGSETFFTHSQIGHAMPQKIHVIIHAPPYGSKRCLSALRVASALAGKEGGDAPEVRVFRMSDATVLALHHQ